MSSSKKRILIMGGTGFIGRNLAEYFSKQPEFEVHTTYFRSQPPAIKNAVFHQCDLRNPEEVTAVLEKVDILIQAAATTSGSKDIVNSPALHVTDNAVMNSYIMKAASECKVSHVIFFSCTVMYPSLDRPVKEEDFFPDKIFPKYFGVAWTKVYIEKVCEFFAATGNSKFTVIRHSNIYGPHDKYDLKKSHVFGATISKVMAATKDIVVWGDGQETRDFLYIDDLVGFVHSAIKIQDSKYELVNVGKGENISVAELVSRVISISGKKLDLRFDTSMPNIPTNVILDISKAKKMFNWQPSTSIDAGILKSISWYKENVQPK